MRAAVEALKQDVSVLLVSKSLLGKAHTVMAEGGIAASLGNIDKEDNWKVHFADTYVEGVYLGDWRLVEKLAKDAPERVLELEEFGALFDRSPEGKILQRAFGAHTYRRLCHVGDKTGLELIRTLQDKVLHSGASFLEETMITKLVTDGKRVYGAIGFDLKKGNFVVISAKTVIMASGGLGRMFKVTSNSWESTGDGLSLAYEAGAELMDLEMVQFHPTGMLWPPAIRGLLVTEGVRGDGGLLFNAKGERFMLRYSPNKKELDARDVVARSIYREIMEGRGTEHGGVYLDISYKGAKYIMEKLPSMYMQFKEFSGVDITKEKMEVAPTLHYHMGGIRIDPETNETRMKGLFAAGEAASGVHGANRLGGNSLADLLVFGKRTGESAAKYAAKVKEKEVDDSEVNAEIDRVLAFLNKPDGVNPFTLFERLRVALSTNVGIWRDEENLKKALAEVRQIKKESLNVGVSGSTVFNPGLVTCLEINGMASVAEMLVVAAMERKESRGAHYRLDYPNTDKSWRKNIIFTKDGNSYQMRTEPVPELPPELEALLPKEAT